MVPNPACREEQHRKVQKGLESVGGGGCLATVEIVFPKDVQLQNFNTHCRNTLCIGGGRGHALD